MDLSRRHKLCWRIAYDLLRPAIEHIFHLVHEDADPAGPCLVIANHVTDFDPLLVAMSFPRTDLYFVASEHLFRKGLISRLLFWAMAPISRRKGSQGTDTVKACLRHLKEGHAVCIFAEGDACWDGRSAEIFPATGKLARVSGASLLTYRLEGGYLTKPRWSKTLRRGKILGHPVACYTLEQLKTMRADEITEQINRDIFEDAWQRQREEHVKYRGKRLAESLELALFCCPHCRRFGTLHSRDDRISCACGLSLRYGEDGFFSPPEPFATLADWEDWQQEELRNRQAEPDTLLFSDGPVVLSRVEGGHREEKKGSGLLVLYPEILRFNEMSFSLNKIGSMAMVQKKLLLFSCGDEYYELRAEGDINLRKYLSWWKNSLKKQE